MTALHLPTAYFIAGILYLAMPMAVWLLLRGESTRTILLWCLGGLLFGSSLVLLGLRGQLPDGVTYGVANGLLFTGTLLCAVALRHELHRPVRLDKVLASGVLFVLVYEGFNSVWRDATLRFVWSSVLTSMVLIWVALLARQLHQRERSWGAWWLFVCYAALGGVVGLRALKVMVGWAEPTAMHVDALAALMIFLGVATSIAGNLGFLGMFFERKSRHLLQAATHQARQEEASRLGDQIAQLDRRRSLGEMAASLAHELSQPLTNIYLITDRLDMELKSRGDATLDKYFQDINRNTQKAGDILGRIRTFIRGKETLFERVDLRQVVADVQDLIRDLARNESVVFRVSACQEDVFVSGDPVQLSQILLNIFRNSIQATEGQAERVVDICIGKVGKNAEVKITDNGPGLLPEVMERVSKPFFTTKSDGLGVGLSIARSIAKQHKGSLSIGNSPAGGAMVLLLLPAIA